MSKNDQFVETPDFFKHLFSLHHRLPYPHANKWTCINTKHNFIFINSYNKYTNKKINELSYEINVYNHYFKYHILAIYMMDVGT